MRERGRGRETDARPRSVTPRLRRTLGLLAPLLVLLGVLAVSVVLLGAKGSQSFIDGAVTASVIIPGAIGLSLLYGIRKFANFAHGELMTLGAFVAYFVNVQLEQSIVLGFLTAPLVLAFVGIALEWSIFSKLEGKGPVAALVASIGVSLILQNLVAALWGTDFKVYDVPLADTIPLPGGHRIAPIKGLLTLALGATFVLSVHFLLTRTTLGKAMRATSDNMELARTTGIRARRVILWTWVLSAALAAVAGILIGFSRDIRPTMGFDLLLLVFAAVILGGIGSAYGAMLGGLVIGLATEMSGPYLDWLDTNAGLVHGIAYKPVVAFLIMVLVLLVRPQGILGGKRPAGGTGAVRWLRSRLVSRGGRSAPAGVDHGL